MRILRFSLLLALAVVLAPNLVVAQKITKESFTFEGKKRTYYLYVPATVKQSQSAPLVVLLHGSNHIGLSLADKWNNLAEREGIIIVAPDSADSAHWSIPNDGPLALYQLVEALKKQYPINPKKVYMFGHSGGAVFALLMSLYESEYFAATAIHAGSLNADAELLVPLAKRKTPIHIQVGTVDEYFPLSAVRGTRNLLNTNGFEVQLVEIAGHNHWYYDTAPKINQVAWDFLKAHELKEDPKFVEYQFKKDTKASKQVVEQYNLGIEHHRKGDLAGAIAAYTRAIELDSKFADAFNNRGIAYMSQQNMPAAIADFTRSLELAPSEAAHNNRGNIYFSQQKIEEATADFSAAIRMKASPEAYANRGIAYQRSNRDALARADFEKAIALNPKFGRAYLLRGLMHFKSGEAAAAEKDFDKGFQLDPSLHTEFDPIIAQYKKQ